MIDYTHRLQVHRHRCPPQIWDWLSAKVHSHPDNQIIFVIVGSDLHRELDTFISYYLKKLATPDFVKRDLPQLDENTTPPCFY